MNIRNASSFFKKYWISHQLKLFCHIIFNYLHFKTLENFLHFTRIKFFALRMNNCDPQKRFTPLILKNI
jgi:hypothetical protein